MSHSEKYQILRKGTVVDRMLYVPVRKLRSLIRAQRKRRLRPEGGRSMSRSADMGVSREGPDWDSIPVYT